MKTNVILVVLAVITICSCNGASNNTLAINQSSKESPVNDSLLNGIEQKITNAFVKGNISQTDNDLVKLKQTLLDLNKKKSSNIIVYWYSYACYYHSVLSTIQKDAKKAEKVLDEGIELLEEIDPKTSEHYALLALMESFSIQFSAGIKAPFISSSVKKNGESAMELDSLNLRAYFVLGSSDFYTPEQYGGGKKAEGYLIKAIKLNSQSVKNPFLPSWGKNTAYELLIRLYIRQKRYDDAKKQFQAAITLFPNDYMINQLAAKLVNQ